MLHVKLRSYEFGSVPLGIALLANRERHLGRHRRRIPRHLATFLALPLVTRGAKKARERRAERAGKRWRQKALRRQENG
jgi:hypothetical protein